jgi:hypothetical protein
MFWFIFMADFISGNPVQQNLMEEEMPSSYFNSIITTLMQAVVVSSMSLVLLYAMFQAKSYFTHPRTNEPSRTEQRLYRQCLGDEEFSESLFESRRRMTNLESIPVWQVPKVKSHRTNH